MFEVTKPCTVYISFLDVMPKKFVLTCPVYGIYYFRYLDGKTPRIKFNICHPGQYTGNVPFEVLKIVDIELPSELPDLPPPERNRAKPFRIVENWDLHNSPACIYTGEGRIEVGANFHKYPKPIQVFILLHEIGHFYYKTEHFCDLFALVHYLQMGFNRSMAIYSLTHVLTDGRNNDKRIAELFDNIKNNVK